MSLKKNLLELFGIKKLTLIKTNTNKNTSNYQIGIYIKNSKEFNNVQSKIRDMILKDTDCVKKTNNKLSCKVKKNNDYYVFGQKSGDYNILSPEKFEKPGVYLIRHGVCERILLNPRVFTKELYIKLMNFNGKLIKSKKTKRKKSKRMS